MCPGVAAVRRRDDLHQSPPHILIQAIVIRPAIGNLTCGRSNLLASTSPREGCGALIAKVLWSCRLHVAGGEAPSMLAEQGDGGRKRQRSSDHACRRASVHETLPGCRVARKDPAERHHAGLQHDRGEAGSVAVAGKYRGKE
jgi:hypothetical protein